MKPEPMILKMWVKVNLFCDNHVVITDWKNDKKIQVYEVLIFWKRTVTVNLKKFFSNIIFRYLDIFRYMILYFW